MDRLSQFMNICRCKYISRNTRCNQTIIGARARDTREADTTATRDTENFESKKESYYYTRNAEVTGLKDQQGTREKSRFGSNGYLTVHCA